MKGMFTYLRTKGQQVIDAIQLPLKARTEIHALDGKILDLEGKISKAKLAIEKAKATDPVPWDTITDSLDSLNLDERRLKQLQDLKHEMFEKEITESKGETAL